MFGRRVPKTDLRIVANGYLDETNALLGLARVDAVHPLVTGWIASFQNRLVFVMGELATHEDDWSRYHERGGTTVDEAMLRELDTLVHCLENEHHVNFQRWAVPGAAGSRAGATLDLARTVVRHAERAIVTLDETGKIPNPLLLRWINRLSDILWLLARLEEKG